jgi:hypothetical protein
MSMRAFATIVLALAACGGAPRASCPTPQPSCATPPAKSPVDRIRERIEGTWIISQSDAENDPETTVERELQGFVSLHDGVMILELRMPEYYKVCSGTYRFAADARTVSMQYDNCMQWSKEKNSVGFGLVWPKNGDPNFAITTTDKGEIVFEEKQAPRRFLFRPDNLLLYRSALHPPAVYQKAFRKISQAR